MFLMVFFCDVNSCRPTIISLSQLILALFDSMMLNSFLMNLLLLFIGLGVSVRADILPSFIMFYFPAAVGKYLLRAMQYCTSQWNESWVKVSKWVVDSTCNVTHKLGNGRHKTHRDCFVCHSQRAIRHAFDNDAFIRWRFTCTDWFNVRRLLRFQTDQSTWLRLLIWCVDYDILIHSM